MSRRLFMSKVGWKRATLHAVLVVALVAGLSSSANAGVVTLYHVSGVIADAIGRPLEGVTVYDNYGHSDQTDSAGAYDLPEEDLGTVRLTATRTDLAAKNKTIQVDLPLNQTNVNITLLYLVSGSIGNRYLSTADGPATTTLTIDSRAPLPGLPGTSGASCVKVGDSRTGLTSDATYVALNPSGSHRWEYALTADTLTADGNYLLTASAVDCSSGVVLTTAITRAYDIDNLAPSIPPMSITPRDNTTTTYSSGQPLVAEIKDFAGVGVDPATVVFTLKDLNTNTTETFGSADGVTLNGVWAKAPALPLTDGHRYWLKVAAADRAGNTAVTSHDPSSEGGFTASSLTTAATVASITDHVCNVPSSAPLGSVTKLVTCVNIPLTTSDSAFAAGDFDNGGSGFADFEVPLTSVKMRSGAVPWEAYEFRSGDGWETKVVTQSLTIPPASTGPQTVIVSGGVLVIPELKVEVPVTWTGETTIYMDPFTTATASVQGHCPDPSASPSIRCSPDPTDTRYTVRLDPAADVDAVAQNHAASYEMVLDHLTRDGYVASLTPGAAAALATAAGVLDVVRDPHFGFNVSGNQLQNFVITDTAAGQDAIDNFETLYPDEFQSSGWMCIPNSQMYNVVDLSAASGQGPVVGGSPTTWVYGPRDQALGFTMSALADGERSLGLTTMNWTCPGGSGPGGCYEPDNCGTTREWSSEQNPGGNCSTVNQGIGTWTVFSYVSCNTPQELWKDDQPTLDFWSLGMWVSGKTCGESECPRMRSLGVSAKATTPAEWADDGLGAFDPGGDSTENCQAGATETIGLSYKILTIERTMPPKINCEKWTIDTGATDGSLSNTWSDGGTTVRGTRREAAFVLGVKLAERTDMRWTVTSTIGFGGS